MAAKIEQVQPVDDGWGFNLKDSKGRRWMTFVYATPQEANTARNQIEVATVNAVNLVIVG